MMMLMIVVFGNFLISFMIVDEGVLKMMKKK